MTRTVADAALLLGCWRYRVRGSGDRRSDAIGIRVARDSSVAMRSQGAIRSNPGLFRGTPRRGRPDAAAT